MTLPDGYLHQHLIDPELCGRCNGCEEACTRKAILHDYRNYAVDVERCDQRMDCIRACSSGAIDNWRIVPQAAAYPVANQLEWLELPPPVPLAAGARFQAVQDAPGQAGRRPHPPRSAPRPEINLHTPKNPATAVVAENRALTDAPDNSEVRHVVLDFEGLNFPLLEGQSVGVIPPGHDAHGHRPHVRLYSVASAREGERPGTRRTAFTVKRVLQDHAGRPVRGLCSNYLCDLPAGSRVSVTGPVGESFLMPDEPGASLLMICTGTGIAPMRGMIQRRHRLAPSLRGPMTLFYGGRTPAELPYLQELQALPPALVDMHVAYSRVTGKPRQYVQDALRANASLVRNLILHDRCYIYICGLTSMERGVHEALADILRPAGADCSQLVPQLMSEGRFHTEVY
jgi:benzoyl-CoA 2,3-dioxygenase component A